MKALNKEAIDMAAGVYKPDIIKDGD